MAILSVESTHFALGSTVKRVSAPESLFAETTKRLGLAPTHGARV